MTRTTNATPAHRPVPSRTGGLVELLNRIENGLPQMDRAGYLAAIAPGLRGLRKKLGHPEAGAATDRALAICRRLHASGRSTDAMALSQAALVQAHLANDDERARRAYTARGLLLADVGDVVGAIDHHIRALRIADARDDVIEASRAWNNIGGAFGGNGIHALAVQCYNRSLARVECLTEPLFSRFAALTNLANSAYHGGRVSEGLTFANRALLEITPAIHEQDPHAVILLRRNLARLLIDRGSLDEAGHHVLEVQRLAGMADTPRAAIAAATTQAAFEAARGRFDVALTRLEGALARAREVPIVLRDTLVCVIRAEEAAGNPERALMRLRELSDHVYLVSVERARQNLVLARGEPDVLEAGDPVQEQAKARLLTRIGPPTEPAEWKTLQRLAMGAALRIDSTGQHGMRVGAITKALALASGRTPLEALEIGLAAELHDIGMLSVPESIVQKHGALNPIERSLVRRHTDAGAEILRDDHHPRILMAREIARYHHAWWDGSGYPERICGRFIPLPARLCAVADAYDTMVCGVERRKERTMDEALAELDRVAGSQLDPELVRCFDALIRGETSNRGIDPTSVRGFETFRELIASLQEDRGFI